MNGKILLCLFLVILFSSCSNLSNQEQIETGSGEVLDPKAVTIAGTVYINRGMADEGLPVKSVMIFNGTWRNCTATYHYLIDCENLKVASQSVAGTYTYIIGAIYNTSNKEATFLFNTSSIVPASKPKTYVFKIFT